jgi:hypothetical protein
MCPKISFTILPKHTSRKNLLGIFFAHVVKYFNNPSCFPVYKHFIYSCISRWFPFSHLSKFKLALDLDFVIFEKKINVKSISDLCHGICYQIQADITFHKYFLAGIFHTKLHPSVLIPSASVNMSRDIR